jgi:SAM-dependent methyltransferase
MADAKRLSGGYRRRLFLVLARLSNALFGPDLSHRVPPLGVLLKLGGVTIGILSPAHRRQRRFERQHPEAPWFAPQSLPVIEGLLEPHFVAFEWGAGRSTAWLAARVAHLTSVEGDPKWAAQVARRIGQAGLVAKVDLRLVPIASRYRFSADERARYTAPIARFPDRHFDLVVVVGLFRPACLGPAAAKLKPGGLLVLDNADRPDLAEWVGALSEHQIGLYSNGIWETAIYRAPAAGLAAPRAAARAAQNSAGDHTQGG